MSRQNEASLHAYSCNRRDGELGYPMYVENGRVPIKIWSSPESVEAEALQQLKNTAALPFVFKHLAVMPDVHFGIGATVGSVVATKGAICPATVGVDIGCGMIAVKTGLDYRKVGDRLPEVRHSIERAVPVGFENNRTIRESVEAWPGWETVSVLSFQDRGLLDRARSQMGSLGGGNHFIEICLDSDNAVWVMLHSGSRYFGNKMAERHIESAKGWMKKMFITLPDPDLAYFAVGQPEFQQYITDVAWIQGYAFQNRIEMMDRVMRQLAYLINNKEPVPELLRVNCHHNYVEWENHFGENVLVTRKGAVRARKGDMGIIPGSMGTKSYIVRGLGNPESFDSCSHGAGRRMSRKKARQTFTKEDVTIQTAGVECRKDMDIVDELPGAYKKIEDVMEHQKDLVEVVAEIKQILCVKG